MTNSNNAPGTSKIDKYLLDPAFNVMEKVAVEAVKLPINLIRYGIKALVNGVVGLVIPVHKK